MIKACCFWQWNDASLDVPTQDDLMHRFSIFFSQAFDDRVLKYRLTIARKWGPSHADDLVLSHQFP